MQLYLWLFVSDILSIAGGKYNLSHMSYLYADLVKLLSGLKFVIIKE